MRVREIKLEFVQRNLRKQVIFTGRPMKLFEANLTYNKEFIKELFLFLIFYIQR